MALSEADVRSWWLARLRWGSVAGQVVITLVASRLARMPLPLGTLLGLTGLMAVTNVALHAWLRSGRAVSTAWAGAILAFDMAQLTGLLYVSGGASNPFSVFYLVQITAAAATLGSRWTWFLAALGLSAYAGLFALPTAEPADAAVHAAHDFARHLQTMWIALTLAAALTAFFVTRLTAAVARRDVEIASMRDAAARRERLTALSTLAAGAAHELATPLMTVAVVAGELERAVASLPEVDAARVAEDVRLMRSEVARCREILDGMGAGSGSTVGEMPMRFTAAGLASEVLSRLRPDVARRVRAAAFDDQAGLFLPRRALARVVLSLVQNALDASPEESVVTLDIVPGEALDISVADRGAGMTSDVSARAGEPFFSTKPPGQGLGLGLFLARSLADELGGTLELDSAPGRGTVARLRVPLQVSVHDQPA
jgi:two-component system, sensor histidine kinase RegB